MSRLPVFIPSPDGPEPVRTEYVEVPWLPDMPLAGKQAAIAFLHAEARKIPGIVRVLEVSSKSSEPLGIALSAFSLPIALPGGDAASVECAYQGSKVFERGGPFTDLFGKTSKKAKTDGRLRTSGYLTGFRFAGMEWGLEPKTAFYDWLYIGALVKKPDLAKQLQDYSAFTDIEFDPEHGISCQARSVALFISLQRRNLLDEFLRMAGSADV